jgi:hypothetical protein
METHKHTHTCQPANPSSVHGNLPTGEEELMPKLNSMNNIHAQERAQQPEELTARIPNTLYPAREVSTNADPASTKLARSSPTLVQEPLVSYASEQYNRTKLHDLSARAIAVTGNRGKKYPHREEWMAAPRPRSACSRGEGERECAGRRALYRTQPLCLVLQYDDRVPRSA